MSGGGCHGNTADDRTVALFAVRRRCGRAGARITDYGGWPFPTKPGRLELAVRAGYENAIEGAKGFRQRVI